MTSRKDGAGRRSLNTAAIVGESFRKSLLDVEELCRNFRWGRQSLNAAFALVQPKSHAIDLGLEGAEALGPQARCSAEEGDLFGSTLPQYG